MKGLIIYFYFFKGWGVNFGVLVMKLFHSGLTSNFKVRGFDAKLLWWKGNDICWSKTCTLPNSGNFCEGGYQGLFIFGFNFSVLVIKLFYLAVSGLEFRVDFKF